MTATMSDLHAVYSADLREKEVTRDQQKTPKMQRRTPGMRLFARQVAEVSARLADESKWKGVHHRHALDGMLAPRKVRAKTEAENGAEKFRKGTFRLPGQEDNSPVLTTLTLAQLLEHFDAVKRIRFDDDERSVPCARTASSKRALSASVIQKKSTLPEVGCIPPKRSRMHGVPGRPDVVAASSVSGWCKRRPVQLDPPQRNRYNPAASRTHVLANSVVREVSRGST